MGGTRVMLIILGIFGALMVAQPGMSAASPWATLGFITALAAAIRDLITRRVPSSIPPLVTTLTVVVLLTLSAPSARAVRNQVVPTARHMGLMGLAAALLITGHTLLFIAYKTGRPRTVAPFMYTLTVWSGAFEHLRVRRFPQPAGHRRHGAIVATGLGVVLTEGRGRGFRRSVGRRAPSVRFASTSPLPLPSALRAATLPTAREEISVSLCGTAFPDVAQVSDPA